MIDTKENDHIAAAEMGDEDNYNMIDGIPNNTTKPSVLERMNEYNAKIADQHAEQSERRKTANQTEL